jgi:hypothetical protein
MNTCVLCGHAVHPTYVCQFPVAHFIPTAGSAMYLGATVMVACGCVPPPTEPSVLSTALPQPAAVPEVTALDVALGYMLPNG